MTEKIKLKLLRQIQRENMSREKIEQFCSAQTSFDREHEIDLIDHCSPPIR